MNSETNEQFGAEISQIAADFSYPPTPDLAAGMVQRLAAQRMQPMRRSWQPAWAPLVAVTIVLAVLLSIAPVRAALVEWLQIGGVRIWQTMPPTPAGPAVTPPAQTPFTVPPTPTLPLSTLDFTGETTLAEAQAAVAFPIRLPTVPADLGEPDHVYLQRAEGDLVILVWMEPLKSEQVQMSLHLLGPGAFVGKMAPPVVVDTVVHGERAIWTEGPYYIQAGGGWGFRRLVEGNVLIWTEGEMTYRLESALALEEAIVVAESLVVIE